MRTKIANRKSEVGKPKFVMYRRPKFLEVLHAIREEMSREVDYDVDLFSEMVRSGVKPAHGPERIIRGLRTRAPRDEIAAEADAPEERSRRRVGKSR
ncbi:MAG: hypothetical protein ABR556_08620 [Pyrinomonadaceae bacterium]